MSPRYPSSWLDELYSRTDIVQVVSGYVSLKKNGRNYWGLCPFHGEKTASFSVSPDKQFYYCFGCKAGGNAANFLMEMERCSYHEAVEMLAERAHMPLPEMINDPDAERRRSERARLLDANREAARFYHETLFTPAGAASLAYLRKRGLSDGVIRKFGLGAAPDSWDALTKHLLEAGFTRRELTTAGLSWVREKENEPGKPQASPDERPLYDVFRNRAMFPIIDQYKNVIAFGGRLLGKGDRKYINTMDTPVFNKRKGVYAANLLRQQRHLNRVILVEGYMDVVSLTQFGVEGVCATLGTALTNEQARLLRRFAPEVYLAYDGDGAGQHAILRGLDILEQEGIPARVLDFPDGLDPDEYVRRDGAEGFRSLPVLSPAVYRLRRLKESFDLSSQEDRIAYARGAAAILRPLDPVERDAILKTLSVETGFSREVLAEQVSQTSVSSPQAGTVQEPARKPVRTGQNRSEPAPSESVRAQEMLLGLLATGQIPKEIAEEKDFEEDELKSLYTGLLSGASPAALMGEMPDEASRSRCARIFSTPVTGATDEMITIARDCVSKIRLAAYQKRLAELTAQLSAPSSRSVTDILQEMQELNASLQKLRNGASGS